MTHVAYATDAATSAKQHVRKLWRFLTIYGPGRTLFKVAGRLRLRPPTWPWRSRVADTGLIGCGQFGFSTIGYFLQRRFGARIVACYDIDPAAAQSLARALRVPHVCTSVDELLSTPGLRRVYIASNHASHAGYACRALERGLDVYVEKPVAVAREQLVALLRTRRRANGLLWAGYNRPFSAAMRWLRLHMPVHPEQGITLQCFVIGHQLASSHWYRRPDEGTRVCGNMGHWLDLLVHVLSWRSLPDRLDIALSWADDNEADDNLAITISTDRHDLFGVTLTSRNEPFEGIRESIHMQHGETTAEIEDFRRVTLWQGPRRQRRHFWPKDVGHELAILQPFAASVQRDWHEVELSTLLMLHITEMVRRRDRHSHLSLSACWAEIEHAVSPP